MFNLNLEKTSGSKTKKGDLNQVYDVIVIGAGSAGLTTAIYTARDGWKTLILEKDAPGGLASTTHWIENYPGFPEGVEGPALMDRFEKQALRFGAELEPFLEVERIDKDPDGIFSVHLEEEQVYRGKTVLLATGSKPRKLGIPGEDEYYNRGVSYCATCDGPLYKDQEVVVIGCGNSGLQEAQILLQYASQVNFVEYLDHSIAEQVLQDRVQSHPKAVCLLSHQALEVVGDQQVTGLKIKDRDSGEVREIPTDAVFIYIGYSPHTDFVADLVDLDQFGYIETDRDLATSTPGIFAAGDVRSGNLAQIAVAVGDGAKAAVSIREYLQENVPVQTAV